MAYRYVRKDLDRAIRSYRKAINANSGEPRFYAEIGRLFKLADVPFDTRMEMFEKHLKVIKRRDDALSIYIQCLIRVGRYDAAIQLLKNNYFRRWEGGGSIRDVYVNAYLLRGRKRAQNGNTKAALRDYHQALEYPRNLEAAKPYSGGRQTQIYCLMARARAEEWLSPSLLCWI